MRAFGAQAVWQNHDCPSVCAGLSGSVHYFDLEDYTDLAKLTNPKLVLDGLEGLVIIDEIQRRPDLFPYLRVVVDKKPLKFLILGSASQELIRQSSETLAGRIAYIDVTPFHCRGCKTNKSYGFEEGFRGLFSPPQMKRVRVGGECTCRPILNGIWWNWG